MNNKTKYRFINDNIRYEYLIQNIYNKKVYTIYSNCDDVIKVMEKEGYNPNDWLVLMSCFTNC